MAHKQFDYFVHTYILLNVLVCFIAEYFDEPGESKSKKNLKNTQQYCTCKHLISYVLSNCFISYADLIGQAEQSK